MSKIRHIGKGIYRWQDKSLEKASSYNYHLARSYYHHQLERRSKQFEKSPVLIYQMGKVGSSSVTHTLRQLKLERAIYHVHTLTNDYIKRYEDQRRDWLRTRREPALKHIWLYQYLRQKLDQGLKQKWKIVTLIRDPVARNLSTFFQNMEVVAAQGDAYTFFSPEHQFEITVDSNNLEDLIALFFEKIHHEFPLLFFDREFKALFNIDVAADEFPIEQGYKIYEGENADILLIRLENLNDCVTDAFKAFLDIDDFTLQNTNIASEKVYADVYQQFKKSIVLPAWYLNSLYDSKLIKHFYSPQEIAKFRNKWTRNGFFAEEEVIRREGSTNSSK